MSLRVRLTLLCAIAVAATVVLATTASYIAVRNRLHDQTDASLRANATSLAKLPAPEIALPFFELPPTGSQTYMGVTYADGQSKFSTKQSISIPVSTTSTARSPISGERCSSSGLPVSSWRRWSRCSSPARA